MIRLGSLWICEEIVGNASRVPPIQARYETERKLQVNFWRVVVGIGVIVAAVAFWLTGHLLFALTVVGGVPGIWYVVEKTRKKDSQVISLQEARLLTLSKPKEFEIRPVSFEAHLAVDIPYIEVTFCGVNYHAKRQASVQRLVVTQLSVAGRSSVVSIEGLSRTIPASSSEPIYCKKNLTEAEVRALGLLPNRGWIVASCNAVADVNGLRRKGPPLRVTIQAQEICGTVVGGSGG